MNKLKNLSSFALISVNWEEKNSNFIDLIKPFVIYAINPPRYELISISDIAEQIEDNFGISIPRNIIDLVLNRLVKEQIIIKDQDTYKYKTGYNLSKLVEPFIETREKHIQEQEKILDEFINYCKNQLSINYTREDAEKIVLNYLEKYSHNIFLKINIDEINIDEDSNYIMGKFLEYLLEEKKSVYKSLEKIIKGFLIANSIYNDEEKKINENKSKMKFKETSIYLDTSFVFFALGYGGKELEESCIELVDLLIELGAELKVHPHVVNEIKNILDAYKILYDKGELEKAYDFDYFIKNEVTSTTIILYKSSLKEDLYELNIIVEETPEYKEDNVYIDHRQLEEHLKSTIRYSGENADISIRNDVESVSSIYRIREGRYTTDIEDCRAVFMTTNAKLVREVKHFIDENEKTLSKQFPPIITDINLTGIAWLKSPTKYPNLPKKNIIADAYSLQQPSKKFWDSYIEKVNILSEEKVITKEDTLLLKYELSKAELMEATCGREDKLSHKNIIRIMEEVKLNREKELKKELEDKDILIEQHQEEIKKQKEEQKIYIKNKSIRYANEKIRKHHKVEVTKHSCKLIVTTAINVLSLIDLISGKKETNRLLINFLKIFGFIYLIYLIKDSNICNTIKDVKNIKKISEDDLKERYSEKYNKYQREGKERFKKEFIELTGALES